MNIIEELGAAKVVGITGHIRPDGDCTGSVLGLFYIPLTFPKACVTLKRV